MKYRNSGLVNNKASLYNPYPTLDPECFDQTLFDPFSFSSFYFDVVKPPCDPDHNPTRIPNGEPTLDTLKCLETLVCLFTFHDLILVWIKEILGKRW